MAGKTLAIPVWNQLWDPDRFGVTDPLAPNDCGEECCAMGFKAVKDKEVTERWVRDRMPGHGGDARTTNVDHCQFLSGVNIPAHPGTPGVQHLLPVIGNQLQQNRATHVLGYYVSPAFLHWIIVRRWYGGMVGFNDPYGGHFREMPQGWLTRYYGGETVEYQLPVLHLSSF